MKRFYLPTEIVMGESCFSELGSLAARHGQRSMLVCGKRSLRASGLEVTGVKDCTPVPHNGCRQKKRRRV